MKKIRKSELIISLNILNKKEEENTIKNIMNKESCYKNLKSENTEKNIENDKNTEKGDKEKDLENNSLDKKHLENSEEEENLENSDKDSEEEEDVLSEEEEEDVLGNNSLASFIDAFQDAAGFDVTGDEIADIVHGLEKDLGCKLFK